MSRRLQTPAISALARSTIRVAFEDLESTLNPADYHALRSASTLEQVRSAALDIERQLAARQALRNMRRLAPLLDGLEHYAKAVDILCNGTPYLAWLWSPVTLILRVASEYIEAFEVIMKGYSRIADSLARFSILSDTFSSNSGFQETLAVFYADILEFHKHAYKFVRRKAWKLLFHTSWGRFQRRFGTILEDLKRHGDLIDLEANAHDISEARQMRQQLCTWRADSLERVKSLDEQQAAKQYKYLLAWLKVDESEQVSIFDAIAEEGTRHPGTCGWILKHPKICAWLKQQTDTRYIWLHGSPGSGKSVLAAQLVTFLLSMNCHVVRHFSTYRYPASTKYESILRSILIQLVRGNEELIVHMYRECVLNKRLPSLSVLEQLVDVMLQGTSETPHESRHIWILLDGFDECEPGRQPRLLSLLNHMATHGGQESGVVCKVLVSSRKSPVLKRRLTRGTTVSLSDEAERPNLEAAIKKYASRRLYLLGEKIRELDFEPEELHEIECAIAKKADGMFLYARLILDHLATNLFYTREEIVECVRTLPPKLADFYHEILAQILSRLDSRSVDRLRCVFGWIAFSKRPLKRLEFLSALSFSSGTFDISRLVPHYILDACGPLVEERNDTCLSFVHVSVKEFLQSPASDLPLREHEILHEHGLATFSCLLSSLGTFIDTSTCGGQTRSLRLVKGLHGFHVYATEFWTDYLLEEAAAGLDVSSPYFQLAQLLSTRLEALISVPVTPDEMLNTPPDKRLDLIQQHGVLHRQAWRALAARSLKQLQADLLPSNTSSNQQSSLPPEPKDGISVLLRKYQHAVEDLVNQESCPGASTEELELFKKTFRTSAYTCRLHSCPRATIGFESEADRHDHEMGHAGGFRCTAPLCQYPPFPTDKSLKSHIATCHAITPPLRSIRRVGLISQAPHRRLEISGSSSLRDSKTVALTRTTTTYQGAVPEDAAAGEIMVPHQFPPPMHPYSLPLPDLQSMSDLREIGMSFLEQLQSTEGRLAPHVQAPTLGLSAPDRNQHRGMYSDHPTATTWIPAAPPMARTPTPVHIDLHVALPPIATGMSVHESRNYGQAGGKDSENEGQENTLECDARWTCRLPEDCWFQLCFPSPTIGACRLCDYADPCAQRSAEYRQHSSSRHSFSKCRNAITCDDFEEFSVHLRDNHGTTLLKWSEEELRDKIFFFLHEYLPSMQEMMKLYSIEEAAPRVKRKVHDTGGQFSNTPDQPSLQADQASLISPIQDTSHIDDGTKRRKLADNRQEVLPSPATA